tara:strand:+ start:448 stop:834 length:387 start_codon:yes stop_codon:yes gene_type:complete
MKKISLLTKISFHTFNIGLIILYLYPGSVLGWLIYNDFQKQPQITGDFIISSNHFYAFMLLSLLGIISFSNEKIKILFIYLIFIAIFLELCHIIIVSRSFQYSDLFGNLLGVFFILFLFNFYQYLKSQ